MTELPAGCGVCGGKTGKEADSSHYAVKVGAQWIARFVYPTFHAKEDKAWGAMDGPLLAPKCKAILGPRPPPYVWAFYDAASFTADKLGGKVVRVCATCAKGTDGGSKRKRKDDAESEDT